MKIIQRRPDRAYISNWLEVPKQFLNVDGTKRSLTFLIAEPGGNVRELRLWKETTDHLLVPRALWRTTELPYPVIDCRPQHFTEIDFKSNILLDHLPGIGGLEPTGQDLQQRALNALIDNPGGILQLACVAGDTILNLNRAGKGFKMTIADVYKRLHRSADTLGPDWDPNILTYIRTKKETQVGLHRMLDVVFRGIRCTYEIKTQDGKSIRVTSDHELLTPDGFKSIDDNLSAGDSVIVDGGQSRGRKKAMSDQKKKPVYKRLHWYGSHPFAHKNGIKRGEQELVLEEHRAVAEAALNRMSLEQFRARCSTSDVDDLVFIDPAKFHVHHIDENPLNNSPDNLEVLPAEEHLKHHRPGAKAFGYGLPTETTISSITKYGMEPVYDVVCDDPHHNFVANGIVVHNCGKGKTVVFLELVAQLRVPTLVIIDNTTLLEQWRGEVNKMLTVPGGVGLIQADVFDWRHGLVLSTYHTIAARADTMSEEVRRWFGLIGWDEGHHIAAPTFAKSADLFYGKRVALTATPTRVDGTHVVYEFHVGPVVFKDLTQAIKPRIYFKWTGFEVDASDPTANIRDRNRDVHLVKLFAHIGSLRPRLDSIVQDIGEAIAQNRRKILVLSNSVPAILNLATLLIHGPAAPLYSDIATPQPHEVGESVIPLDLSLPERRKKQRAADNLRKLLDDQTLNPIKQGQYQTKLIELETALERCRVFDKIQAELRRRQLAFIRDLQRYMGPDVGVMIGDIKSEERMGYARNSRVLLAIMKYGKEGLDAPAIDTVLVLDPFSQRNGLQQLIGRVARASVDKLEPVVVFYEDNVGPIIAMCRKLQKHLNEWSQEEGGPFTYRLFNHPKAKSQWNKIKMFTATGS